MGAYSPVTLTKEQYETIIKVIRDGSSFFRPNERLANILICEANLGIRIGDILKLTPSSFVLDGGRWRLDIVEEKTGKKNEIKLNKAVKMAFDTFFIDPYGDVMPCNGTKCKQVMGNLNEQSWDELWSSEQAEKVRKKVRHCDRQCWMIGSVSPAMHKYIWKPAWWVVKHKFLGFYKKQKYSMFENKIVRDYKDGKVTKEELDKCSTCDLNCKINDGLSEKSKEQLKGKTGEEIVDADIAKQMQNSKGEN